MAGVRDLPAAVRAPDHSEQQLLRAPACAGDAVREERRPELRALRRARAATVRVLLEQVERAAPAVDDHATERRAPDADRRGGDTGGRGARDEPRAVVPSSGGVR